MQDPQIDLNNIQVSKRLQRNRERYLQIINNFGMMLLHKNTIDEIVWLVTKKVIGEMEFVDCVVYLFNEERTHLIQRPAFEIKNSEKQEILNPTRIKVGEGIVGSVAKTGTPELIHNTSKDNRYIIDDRMRLSGIAVPIVYDNKVIGVIDSKHPDAYAFDQEDLMTLTTIAAMISMKIAHIQALEDLKNNKANRETELQRHTQQLVTTIASLKKSNQDLESFAYTASHDMQEPLRTVVSYLQLLQRKNSSLSDESLEFLKYAIDGSKRMKTLLDGLLKYSLIKTSNDSFQNVCLEDTMILVKANLRRILIESDTIFTYEKLPVVFGNTTQLNQLFQNLISNAIKFQKNDQQPHVKISWLETDDYHEISIKDNGLGIAPDFHEKIFDLFKRLNNINDFKGSGIGLSLCKRIVEYHNGTISLQSELGQGSTFIFSLSKGSH